MRKLFSLILHLAIVFLAVIIYFFVNNDNLVFRILALFSFISFLLSFWYCSDKKFTPFFLLSCVIYVFNCGQIWLSVCGISLSESSFSITRFSQTIINEALLFFITIETLVQFFFIIFQTKIVSSKYNTSISLMKDNNRLGEDETQRVGRFFELLSLFVIPLCLLYDYTQVVLARSGGYSVALTARADNEMFYMASSMLPLIIFGVICCERRKMIRRLYLVYGLSRYFLLITAVGYRMQTIAFLCCLLLLYFGSIGKKRTFSLKAIGIYFIWGISIAFLMYLAYSSAQNRRGNEVVFSTASKQVLFSLVQELGGTFIDIPLIMENFNEIGCVFGLSYLFGLVYMIPFIGRVFPGMSIYVSLSSILNNYIVIWSGAGLGGNMLAELFYNFGWFSIIVTPLVAFIYFSVDKNIRQSKFSNEKKAISLYCLYILFLYIRGNVGEITINCRCLLIVLIGISLAKKRRFSVRRSFYV